MHTPRKPDYYLMAKDREDDNKKAARVGAAWTNPKGGISIVLNTCSVLSWQDGVFLTLWPNDDTGKKKEYLEIHVPESDIPF
jgi:hypothetical protein